MRALPRSSPRGDGDGDGRRGNGSRCQASTALPRRASREDRCTHRRDDGDAAVCDEWRDALGEIGAPPSALQRIESWFRRRPTEVQFTVQRTDADARQEVDLSTPLKFARRPKTTVAVEVEALSPVKGPTFAV